MSSSASILCIRLSKGFRASTPLILTPPPAPPAQRHRPRQRNATGPASATPPAPPAQRRRHASPTPPDPPRFHHEDFSPTVSTCVLSRSGVMRYTRTYDCPATG